MSLIIKGEILDSIPAVPRSELNRRSDERSRRPCSQSRRHRSFVAPRPGGISPSRDTRTDTRVPAARQRRRTRKRRRPSDEARDPSCSAVASVRWWSGERYGGERKMRSFDLGAPAGVDVRDAEQRFAIRLLIRCLKRIAGDRNENDSIHFTTRVRQSDVQ